MITEAKRTKHREYMREWRKRNPDKSLWPAKRNKAQKIQKRMYMRRYRVLHPERVRDSQKRSSLKWRRNYPDKRRAHRIVFKAIISGKIIRPKNCSSCLRRIKVQAHHEDYSKPLEVVWVCQSCHATIHGRGWT